MTVDLGARLIRVFPRRTSHTPRDEMAFVGDPPLFRPDADAVHVSVAFSWDVDEGYRLMESWAHFYPTVRIGGPAFDVPRHSDGFVPGRYVKAGVTFTSRGCDNQCGWCLVPQREGKLALQDPIPPGWIIQDNNFLQCPLEHRRKVYAMLAAQPHGCVFAGGIQPSLVTDEIAAEFRDIRILDLFLAADTWRSLFDLEAAARRLSFLGRDRLRCYMLVAYMNETPEQAEQRLRAAWEIGVMPFAQLYQPKHKRIQYGSDWRGLARTWSRPAAMKAAMR